MSAPPSDPAAILRSPGYTRLLVLAAVLGVPISAAAYGFLALVTKLQDWIFTDLPEAWASRPRRRGGHSRSSPLAGVLVGLTIRHLPGGGGHSPADGFKAGGFPAPIELPGIAIAALTSLGLGVVLGPEAPLIALGGGLAVCAVRLARRDVPPQATAVVAAAGSFAAISTLLGSPLLGAFLLMEASGLGGPTLGLVLVPGLLAAGVGSLVFIGLDALDRAGHVLAGRCPTCRRSTGPTSPHSGGRWSSAWSRPCSAPPSAGSPCCSGPMSSGGWCWSLPLVGLAIAALAIVYAEVSGHEHLRRAVLRPGRDGPAHQPERRATRWARSCCWSPARGSPTARR